MGSLGFASENVQDISRMSFTPTAHTAMSTLAICGYGQVIWKAMSIPRDARYDVADSDLTCEVPPKIERPVERMSVHEVRVGRRTLTFSKIIDLELCHDGGVWQYMCLYLNVGGTATSRAEAIRAFKRRIILFWGTLRHWKDECLTPDALVTRAKILNLVVHAIPSKPPRVKTCFGFPVITDDIAPYIHYPYGPSAKSFR